MKGLYLLITRQLAKDHTIKFGMSMRLEYRWIDYLAIFSDSEYVYSKENRIVDSFRAYKENRNYKEIGPSLVAIGEIASIGGALLPAMKVSLLAGATIGEICKELSNAWREIRE